MLNFDIYGLKTGITFKDSKEQAEVAELLQFFLKDTLVEVDIIIEFKKKQRAQEIGALIYPHLAERNIWAMHSGGFHYRGGWLTIGPSNCGKSTFTSVAMRNGLSILSDDITLIRPADQGIELLPFYAKIFINDRALVPEPEAFKTGFLKSFVMPRKVDRTTSVKKLGKRSDLLRKLVPQFLWSYNEKEQGRQKVFVEKLCEYPAFEVCWGPEIWSEHFDFQDILNEIV